MSAQGRDHCVQAGVLVQEDPLLRDQRQSCPPVGLGLFAPPLGKALGAGMLHQVGQLVGEKPMLVQGPGLYGDDDGRSEQLVSGVEAGDP